MQNLIWYSIPGGIFMALTYPLTEAPGDKFRLLALIAVVPVVGFIIHQIERIVVESSRWGFGGKNRHVLKKIKKDHHISNCPEHQYAPFLIWETAFYRNGFPKEFCKHNTSYWTHYHSALSGALSGALAMGFLHFYADGSHKEEFYYWAGFLIIGIFIKKGVMTWREVCRLEMATYFAYKWSFDQAAEAVLNKTPLPIPESRDFPQEQENAQDG